MDNNIEKFFTGKYFRIPNYQRDYAWDTGNVDDLFEDILEAIETETSHYIGTFILAAGSSGSQFNVVDGQQRLTTLIMLFNAVIERLQNQTEQIINKDKFVRSQTDPEQTWKLELLNDNNRFFHEMLEGKNPEPTTRSQQLLKAAYEHIQLRVDELMVDKSKFLTAMSRLAVMEFTENNDGKAIRMFQTVNDRGKPLTNMEKAKSLLVYYSNRFLNGELDEFVNDHFGEIFHTYTKIKTIGEEYQIDVISNRRFSEDSVMRYHYLAYADDMYDYDAPESYVLDTYLKKSLKRLRTDRTELKKFIQDYVIDLAKFYKCFAQIVEHVKIDPKYYKLFSILGISATLYPLTIRLETRDLLGRPLTRDKKKTFIDLIEATDFRVYKVRGTNPRVDMSTLARNAKKISPSAIESELVYFAQRFMSNDEFARYLKNTFHNTPTAHLMIDFGEKLNKRSYLLTELQAMKATQPTVEHIFPQQERFEFPNLGFRDIDDYKHMVQTIGNLTILEKTLNSQCQNRTPDQKVSGGYYERSLFEDARRISAQVKNSGMPYTREEIQKRTKTLSDYCMQRWKV
jgi:uncharacterized protein with ParB-like and HNH nuclease domain